MFKVQVRPHWYLAEGEPGSEVWTDVNMGPLESLPNEFDTVVKAESFKQTLLTMNAVQLIGAGPVTREFQVVESTP